MDFKKMNYKPIELNNIKDEFMGYVRGIAEATSGNVALDNVKKIQEIQRTIDTQSNLASIRNDMDRKNTYYEKENEFWDDNMPIIKEWYIRYYKAVLESDYRKDLEDYLSPMFFEIANNAVRIFDPEIIPLMQKENRFIRKYTKLIASASFRHNEKELNLSGLIALLESTDREERKKANEMISGFFLDNLQELDEIYDKLVYLRNKMAKKLNFKNFYEMSYITMNRIGYDRKDVELYRQRVIDEVVPFVEQALKKQMERNQLESLKNYDIKLKFPNGNARPKDEPEKIILNGVKMYHKLSKETREFINFMVDNNLLDLKTKPGKTSGAYSEYIFDYKSPFIFANFNGTSGDINILTHEAGHAFQAYKSNYIMTPELIWPTSETVEIHSMSMEFFTWPWMDLFFRDETEKYKYGHIIDASMLICYASLVDHFQQKVYENPELTPEERRNVWRKLEKQYNPWIDYAGNKFYENGGRWIRQHHIFTIPFYYIEYSLAQVCALQVWEKDFYNKSSSIWGDFLEICKIGGTKSFSEVLDILNIQSPFKESTLRNVVNTMKKYLESINEEDLI